MGIFGTHAATPDLGVIQEEQLNVISLMMMMMIIWMRMRMMGIRVTIRGMMRMKTRR